jgi:hypothetical protein
MEPRYKAGLFCEYAILACVCNARDRTLSTCDNFVKAHARLALANAAHSAKLGPFFPVMEPVKINVPTCINRLIGIVVKQCKTICCPV